MYDAKHGFESGSNDGLEPEKNRNNGGAMLDVSADFEKTCLICRVG